MTKLKTVITAIVLALVLSSCEKDPIIPHEGEVITSLKYTLTPNGGGTAIVLSFQDLDGDGGNAPIITEGILDTNKTYTGALVLLNEQESPAGNITAEIQEEDEEHQFFFQTNITDLTIAYSDQDADGNPLGLQSTVTTTDAGNGTITIILRHEPNKSASGVANGDITNAGGETDIEVTFDVTVQ
ncbi:MAG: type 1 periplasmic binding fold superfamily protein [Methanosarcinales archaeon]|nr:type 1 periplasmic binding fold superfamily protein [Methanosarcinales archaeon]